MVPYLRAANVKDGALDLTDVKSMNFDPREQLVFALEPGDVLVTEGSGSPSSVGASAVWPGQNGGPVCFQNTLLRLRPRDGTDARFLAWWCRHAFGAGLFASVATGANIFHLSAERVRALRAPVLSLAEQRRIADYLDVEVARIDEMIAVKQEMTAGLAARADSEQEDLVLGLYSPGVEYTNSYLAHLPHGWGLTSIRQLRCSVQTGPFGSQLHAEDYIEGGWPVVNPSNLRDGRIVEIASMCVSDEKRAELSRHILRPGDIVFGRRGEMGRAGIVTDHEEGWLCGTGSLRLRLEDERIRPDYLKAILTTSACKHYFTINSVGSTMENLNADIVLGCPILMPPIGEQDRIVHRMTEVECVHGEAAATITEQIDLLRERRRSLITAVVTGEMEVP